LTTSEAYHALRSEIKALVPKTVYRASNAMNAAFSGFINELFGCEEFARPYQGTEFEMQGLRLRTLNPTDRGYGGDKDTVDRWAKELELEGWYGWRLA
jgi:hypothetical protein